MSDERRAPKRPSQYHEACADCRGWVSEYDEHDSSCPRLIYLRKRGVVLSDEQREQREHERRLGEVLTQRATIAHLRAVIELMPASLKHFKTILQIRQGNPLSADESPGLAVAVGLLDVVIEYYVPKITGSEE